MNRFVSTKNSILSLEYIQNKKENQYFDRKSAKKDPKEISKHIIAFANAGGGILVIGVEDDGSITGFSKVGLHKMDQFKRIPFEYCKTMPEVKFEEVKVKNIYQENDCILIYQIQPSTKRVIRSTSDDVYLRIGDQSRKLTHEQITSLEFDKGERYFEEEIVDRSSIADVDTELLGTYKKAINTGLSDLEVLEGRGLLVDGKLTVAGVLLFSKNPSKFFPNARLRFLRYEGIKAQTGQRINLIKDINIDGPIPKVIEKAKETISSQLREFQTLDATGKFKAVPEYPEFAWLEGVKRIYEEMEKFFLKAPEYSEPNGNSVLLRLDNNYVMRQVRNSEHMEKLFEGGIWDSLSDDEKTIIYIAYREGKINNRRVREVLDRSPGYCRNLLNNLKKLDVLLWRGSSAKDPTQYYELNTFN